MIDFLILYEHKAREMDNICLIAAELERRGYSVDFCYSAYPWTLKYNLYNRPRVVVTPFLYNDINIINCVCMHGGKNTKVVNLQWEQVFSPFVKSANIHTPKNEAAKATHISWGKYNHDGLTQNGIKNAVITGPVHFDFLRKEMLDFYKSKSQIQAEFNLDDTKKIFLYISSFSTCYYSEEKLKDMRIAGFTSTEIIRDEEKKSKLHTIKWIRKLLVDRPDILLIYRPHPVARYDMELISMEKEYSNFRIIHDYSVKQWILIADKIFTWASTSIAEAFFAGKYCGILRPIPALKESDPCIYENAEKITTYEQMLSCIDSEDLPFPIPREDLYCHYDVQETPSYVRICNLLEKVHSTNVYDMEMSISWKRPSLVELFKRSLSYYLIRHNKSYISGGKRRGFIGWVDYLCDKNEAYIKDYFSKNQARLTIKRMREILLK